MRGFIFVVAQLPTTLFRSACRCVSLSFFATGAVSAMWQAPPLVAAVKPLVTQIVANAQDDYPGMETEPAFQRAIAAVATIDRGDFVPTAARALAYRTLPLSIGYGQTISDPYVVTIMTAAVGVGPGQSVLEIGTGSGYQAAVLSRIGARVHSIEIVPELARSAAERLKRFGFRNVVIRAEDGAAGWPDASPFDAIIVTAGAAAIPAPLLAQLRPGGRLVMPIGLNTPAEQLIVVTEGLDGTTTRCSLGPAMFVPLTGRGETQEVPALYDRSVPLCRKGQTARFPGQPIP